MICQFDVRFCVINSSSLGAPSPPNNASYSPPLLHPAPSSIFPHTITSPHPPSLPPSLPPPPPLYELPLRPPPVPPPPLFSNQLITDDKFFPRFNHHKITSRVAFIIILITDVILITPISQFGGSVVRGSAG